MITGGYWLWQGRSTTPSTIKIGAIVILSGDAAAWGENAKKGIDLAVEEINRSGGANGKPIELVYEDTGGEPKRAILAYQKLVATNRVDAIIGPLFQVEVAAISPLVAKDQIPVVTPSYAPIQNRPTPYNPLMVWMDPTIEAGRMAEYVLAEGVKSASVIGTTDSWEQEVSEEFARKSASLGGKIPYKELVQFDATDVRSAITKAVQGRPDAIFLGTYYQFVRLVKGLREIGYRGKLYGIEVDAYLAGETKQLSNGLRFIAPDFYASDFIRVFEQKYNQKPGIPAGQAYDATHILASLLSGKRSSAEVLKAMENFKSYRGVSGEIVVTDQRHTLLPTAIFELQNGEAVRLESQ